MKLALERELDLHVEEELLVPKYESLDVYQPQEEVHGVEETTHVAPTTNDCARSEIFSLMDDFSGYN